MRRTFALAVPLAIVASFSLTGCCYYELRDTLDSIQTDLRCCWRARVAWHNHKHECGDHPYKGAYGHGFRDGYSDVCNGGDGCAPTMPPRCYWNDCYCGGEGQPKVAAYFNGYSQGAYIAQAEGCTGGRLFVGRVAGPGPGPGPMYGAQPHGMSATPAAPATTLPPPAEPPVITDPSTPPPAPPAGGPVIPPDPAYETYNENGLYSE